MKHWRYSQDKVKLVVNKANGHSDASPKDLELVLQYPLYWQVPLDRATDTNRGDGGLVVRSKPNAKISENIMGLSQKLLGVEESQSLMSRWRLKLPFPRR